MLDLAIRQGFLEPLDPGVRYLGVDQAEHFQIGEPLEVLEPG